MINKKALTCLSFLILIAFIFFPACQSKQDEVLSPDLVLINGKIITVNAEDSIAEAVAVKGEKIIAVGTSEKIKKIVRKRHPDH